MSTATARQVVQCITRLVGSPALERVSMMRRDVSVVPPSMCDREFSWQSSEEVTLSVPVLATLVRGCCVLRCRWLLFSHAHRTCVCVPARVCDRC